MNKTPREWLLARHATEQATLDALRRAALPAPELDTLAFLRELFVPVRAVWGSLAVVWLALLVFWSLSPKPAPLTPSSSPSLSSASPQFCLSTSNAQIDALLSETRTLR